MVPEDPEEAKAQMSEQKIETATLGGGCFWCLEPIFDELRGVTRVVPGYAGGHVDNPTYKQVCGGNTGHAEVVQVDFDPSVISYADILRVFFTFHDPTTLNRQGADVGTQYRSVVFYHSDEQKATAEKVVKEIEGEGIWPGRFVTEVVPLTKYSEAEDYHHRYYEQNPYAGYCQVVIAPKVAKFRQKYAAKLKRASTPS
jgi:peptide-methionine (S)-S-oxide reductase